MYFECVCKRAARKATVGQLRNYNIYTQACGIWKRTLLAFTKDYTAASRSWIKIQDRNGGLGRPHQAHRELWGQPHRLVGHDHV